VVQHRGLLVAWTIVFGAFLGGILCGVVELALVAQLAAMTLAVVTVRRSDKRAGLRYFLLYRASLALLLVAAVTCLVAAGSTVFIAHHLGSSHIAGFAGLASTNLVISILAWRALVSPAPRRAAIAGLVAVIVEVVAMLFDIIMNMESRVPLRGSITVTLYASFIATWAGALVCMASVGAFYRASSTPVPEARVVDERDTQG
jgi:hypothetical protein